MRTGLDRLRSNMLPGPSIGLLSHYAAVDGTYTSSISRLATTEGIRLKMAFGPQHGFRGETQDNMIEWEGYTHPTLGIPVHSLYGKTREPAPELLEGLDCLVIDLQDVGARYYTYVYTMAYCMRACARAGVGVVVLDRPNPLGFRVVEGKQLQEGFESFVGLYPIPVRHGLTVGELARLFAEFDSLQPPEVVELREWDGSGIPEGHPWVHPSPNMPSIETALVYPGMCLLEATNLSEGRGTTRPFNIFGAPWVDGERLAARLNGTQWLRGAVLRPHCFIPTFNKHEGKLCGGCEIHVTDASLFRPLRAALGILVHLFEYPSTRWIDPPYEYEYLKMPVDILAGGSELRHAVLDGDETALLDLAAGNPEEHMKMVSDSLLYERTFTV